MEKLSKYTPVSLVASTYSIVSMRFDQGFYFGNWHDARHWSSAFSLNGYWHVQGLALMNQAVFNRSKRQIDTANEVNRWSANSLSGEGLPLCSLVVPKGRNSIAAVRIMESGPNHCSAILINWHLGSTCGVHLS